jgi:uncharacterized protein YbbC (DUF1343 family)
MPTLRFGIDTLLDQPFKPARVGLVTNDAAKTCHGVPTRRALLECGVDLVRLFSPEHGIAASAEDGASVANVTDPVTKLPVISLYGEHTRPPAETLQDLDLILFDIPDIGARFYTYIWTLSHLLEACAESGKPLWVLDRPNPLGGNIDDAEGPILDENFVSTFVGRWSMPVRHCLTVGELATLWNAQRRIDARLQVIPMQGWRRDMHWPQTQLPFVPPSPAIGDYQTALLYAGTCLIEGTNLSEGRGTKAPFRAVGAPWLDASSLAGHLNSIWPSIRATEISFVPTTRKYARQACAGVLIDVVDFRNLKPVRLGLELIRQIIRQHPRQFSWQPYPTAANKDGGGHFDRLAGVPIRFQLEKDMLDLDQCTTAGGWGQRVGAHLLYG